jgi:hypothetical protein
MKIIWLGLMAAVGVGVALAGVTYAGWLPLPTDFFVGVPQQNSQ